MSFNEYKSTTDKNNIDKNYITAQRCEKNNNYKKAMKFYNKNILRYNDNLSKVKLAEIYISGKLGITNNKKARALLKEVYDSGCREGQALYAYMLANGIGGKKDKAKANFIFKAEMEAGNPDPMVYIELSKYLRKNKKKHISNSLKKSVTRYERNKYRRKVSIDKFNNSILGRIANFFPNKISVYFDDIITPKKDDKDSYNLSKLYNRAEELKDSKNVDTARRIYRRLAQYGDKESKIKYAEMCYKGIGGKKDINSAKKIYEDLIITKNRKLSRISNELNDMDNVLEELKRKKSSRRNKKEMNNILGEIEFLENQKSKLLLSQNYKDAELNYGILLTENYNNEDELNRGIAFLKHIAISGEGVIPKGCKNTKNGKMYDKRARKAILKLGNLYETGIWKPNNIDEARELFCKFSTGKISRYTSYISDKMKNNEISTYIPKTENDIISRKKNIKQSKKCNLRYEFGMLCEFLNIKKLARKSFESMHKRGDYRGDYSLARYEHLGKGGDKDNIKAKEHYRAYINSTSNAKEGTDRKMRIYAMKDLADLLLEENDIIEAVQLYKNSAIMGNNQSKVLLRKLYKENKWIPVTQKELELVKLKGINKIITNLSEKYENAILKRKEKNITIPKVLKPIAISTAASVVLAGQPVNIVKAKSENNIPQVNVEEYGVEEQRRKIPARSLVINKQDLYTKKENELAEHIEI